MDKQKLHQLLIDFGYPSHMIEQTIEKINRFQPKIKKAFEGWVANGKEPDIEVHGYAFSQLRKDYGMKAIGAFITLDWLVRDPENAIKSLKRGIR